MQKIKSIEELKKYATRMDSGSHDNLTNMNNQVERLS